MLCCAPQRTRMPIAQEVQVHAALLSTQSGALPPAGVGLIGFGALIALLLVTFAFRNVGQRNARHHD